MAHDHDSTGFCQTCAVRKSITNLFNQTVGNGEGSGDMFINGVIDAVAELAGAHVLAGSEADERKLLQDMIGYRFDHFAALHRQRQAELAVKQ